MCDSLFEKQHTSLQYPVLLIPEIAETNTYFAVLHKSYYTEGQRTWKSVCLSVVI